jgi:hypothetical protein
MKNSKVKLIFKPNAGVALKKKEVGSTFNAFQTTVAF